MSSGGESLNVYPTLKFLDYSKRIFGLDFTTFISLVAFLFLLMMPAQMFKGWFVLVWLMGCFGTIFLLFKLAQRFTKKRPDNALGHWLMYNEMFPQRSDAFTLEAMPEEIGVFLESIAPQED